MSDNDDLLGDDHDDLGDQSLADYNLGNEEEEQLLADDYDTGASQNVPPSVGYGDQTGIVSSNYTVHGMDYGSQPESYSADTECVVPNVTVEVPKVPSTPSAPPKRDPPTYAPYEPPPYEVESAVVPPAIPASPIESPQIVPSEVLSASPNDSLDGGPPRERFISERPVGSQRTPRIRDIPDSLDKVFVPRGGYGPRSRTSWRNPHMQARYSHPYRRNNMQRGNFLSRPSFPPPQQPRPSPPNLDQNRPRLEPPQIPPDLPPNLSPMPPQRPPFRPDEGPVRGPFRPEDGPNRVPFRPDEGPNIRGPFGPEDGPRGPFRPDEGPNIRGPFGPDDGPNRNPFRPDEGPNIRGLFGRDDGPNRGPFRPDEGPNIRGPFGPEDGPNRNPFRPDEGPNIRGPFGPDDGPNRNPFRPDEGPNIRGPFGPDDGPNRGPFRPDEGPNIRGPFGPEDGPNRGPFRPDVGPNIRGPFGPDDGINKGPFRPDDGPIRGPFRTDEGPIRGPFRPEEGPFRPEDGPNRGLFRPDEGPIGGPFRPEDGPQRPFDRPFHPEDGPNMPPRLLGPMFRQERPMFAPMQRFPNQSFGPPFPYRPQFNRFGPPLREVGPNTLHLPQVTIRQTLPADQMTGREQEVRMLPVQLPGTLPPAGLAGKKVLINPHFKGNFQPPPVEGPTNLDDAAERFIAEQRDALARAANRKAPPRRSPQRFIENTTIEIKNDLAPPPPPPAAAAAAAAAAGRTQDDDLLRRQEEFISANRAGLRRRMRSPSPPRSPPRRGPSPPRRRASPPRIGPLDEESEYRRRVREQESIRERVLRAKEVRRRKNAVALQNALVEREREARDKEANTKPDSQVPETVTPAGRAPAPAPDRTVSPARKPDAVARDRHRDRDRSPAPPPARPEARPAENLTPPREVKAEEKLPAGPVVPKSPERNLTPPLPAAAAPGKPPADDSDDDLDLILGDIDGILSDDDEDSGRFKEKAKKVEPAKPKPEDLRSKLPARGAEARRLVKQRIIYGDDKEDKRADRSPPTKKSLVKTSTNTENNGDLDKPDKKLAKAKKETENVPAKSRPRITYTAKEKEAEKPAADEPRKAQPFASRRVVLQRKMAAATDKEKSVFARIEIKNDPTKPNPGIFSRAVRTAIGADKNRIVVKKQEEPQVEYDSDASEEDRLLNEETGNIAVVTNLPHGMTDTRLKTLAGNDVQSVSLDTEERSARVAFKTTAAAETFRRKFNNKMVAASRLTVTLR